MTKVESYFFFNNTFIRVGEYAHALPDDLNHVDGAITLEIDNTKVLTFDHWDYVVVTWGLFSQALAKTKLKTETALQFPDHDFNLVISPEDTKRVRVKYGEDFIITDRIELFEALKKEGKKFFNKVLELKPEMKNEFMEIINLLDSIEE